MTLKQKAHVASVEAYDEMAPFYDGFMSTSYEAWICSLFALAEAQRPPAGPVLDVGCGTGRSLEPLLRRGRSLTGYEPSEPMLAEARARLGDAVTLLPGGLPDLPDGEPAAIVLAVNDVLNCLPAEALEPAVVALGRRVTPGGVLVFDLNTLATYEAFFATTFTRSTDERLFVWHGLGAAAGTHRAELHVFPHRAGADPGARHRVSRHVQHHHDDEAARAAIAAAGLELATLRGQHDDGRQDPTCDEAIHTKRIYVACKR